jgi:hypothetical protein
MKMLPKSTNGPARERRAETEIEWKEYPRIPPGEYPAYCEWGKHYKDPGFRSWKCLLRWVVLRGDLVTEIATLPQWFALGDGEKPHGSRRGNYLKEWVRANGGPPVRGDRLSPRVFTRRMARVQVGDTDPEKSPVPYSVVRRIVSWETGAGPGQSVSKSHSQGWQPLKQTETGVSRE